jgi:hypothetical protein
VDVEDLCGVVFFKLEFQVSLSYLIRLPSRLAW